MCIQPACVRDVLNRFQFLGPERYYAAEAINLSLYGEMHEQTKPQ